MSTDRKPMTALEIAERAYALIEDPARWTQGELARDENGERVEPEDDEAVCFCSGGALSNIDPCGINAQEQGVAFSELERAFGDSVTYFNDNHTHAEVLAGWRRAIDSLRTKEQQ